MTIKFKKLHPAAVIPKIAKVGDAGADLTAIEKEMDNYSGQIIYRTGIAVEIPEGHVGLIFPRSSIYKTSLSLTNSVGVIDSGYRGELTFRFRGYYQVAYNVGDRIGQLVILPLPLVEYEEVEELSTTERGEDGFGSTGK